MRYIFALLFASLVFSACSSGGGGGGGFRPTGKIVAIAENDSSVTVVVGGAQRAVSSGAAVTVMNLDTEETKETTSSAQGSFEITFTASTGDMFRVVVEQDGVDITIGVTLLRDAVSRNLALLGAVPADIEVRGVRAYVVNTFSDNIQVFDLTETPPALMGTIALPLGQGPSHITFINNRRAVVTNNIGHSIAIVNIEDLSCETIIANEEGGFEPCAESVIIPNAFEEPSGAVVASGKIFVTNNNLDPTFSPNGNGFITIIDLDSFNLIGFLDASGANTGNPTLVNGRLWVLNSGNILFDFVTFEFSCDEAFEPSVDVINVSNNSLQNSIPLPLNPSEPNLCLPSSFGPTPDNKFAYIGLGNAGAILKIDLVAQTLVRGTNNPIVVTPSSTLNLISDIKFRSDGIGFFAMFNTDQIGTIDSATNEINPFPFIAPLPAGVRAFDSSSQFLDGVQFLAIPDDGAFPDIYYITTISSQLNSIDTSSIILP